MFYAVGAGWRAPLFVPGKTSWTMRMQRMLESAVVLHHSTVESICLDHPHCLRTACWCPLVIAWQGQHCCLEFFLESQIGCLKEQNHLLFVLLSCWGHLQQLHSLQTHFSCFGLDVEKVNKLLLSCCYASLGCAWQLGKLLAVHLQSAHPKQDSWMQGTLLEDTPWNIVGGTDMILQILFCFEVKVQQSSLLECPLIHQHLSSTECGRKCEEIHQLHQQLCHSK